MFVTTAV
jgi:hypothetical protein